MSRVISYREVYENNTKQILLSEEQYNVLKMDNVQLSVLVNERNKEIERLNNIINELEKYINEEYIYDELGMKIFDASELQDKLQELKGVDKDVFVKRV